jgi:hypothetical protein
VSSSAVPNLYGFATIFKISLTGALVTLHNSNSTDGAEPYGGATDGALYGTTAAGGASSACTGGCGPVFRIRSTVS